MKIDECEIEVEWYKHSSGMCLYKPKNTDGLTPCKGKACFVELHDSYMMHFPVESGMGGFVATGKSVTEVTEQFEKMFRIYMMVLSVSEEQKKVKLKNNDSVAELVDAPA